MRTLRCLFGLAWALLICGAASAQEGRGWLGADVLEVTKADAEKLGWKTPHGAKVGVVASGSPAEKAGLRSGDVIVAVERTMLQTSSEVEAAIAARPPGTVVLLQVLSEGREGPLAVTLAKQAVRDQAPPLLMLDTGGHMALIRDVAFTPDGRQLVSAGDDKVIRIWDWQAGKTVTTIRGQVEPGDEGKIFAMALSPDGRWLAAGGWIKVRGQAGHVVRLFDFATGNLVALLNGHSDIVLSLAFAPDGKRLISGSNDDSAIIWDVEHQKLVHRLLGHTDAIYAAAFSPDGQRVVTGSYDTTVRLWRLADGGPIAELKGHKDKVYKVAVNPIDGNIASGDVTGEIRLWDGYTGRYLRTLVDQRGVVGSLVFSADGTKLLSTCGYSGCNYTQHVWELATGNAAVTYAEHDNIVIAAAISPDGKLAATGGGEAFPIHVWDLKTGETKQTLAGTGARGWAVGFSADGRRVAWGTTSRYSAHNDRDPLTLQLRLPNATQALGGPEPLAAANAKNFVRARATRGDYALLHRQGGRYGRDDAILDIKRGDAAIASIERDSTDGYRHRAYTFTPDGQTIISGGANGFLTAYDLDGKRIGNFIGHEGDVWAVTPSPDGRLLVSGSADQTVRLWSLKSRELIATLFNGTDGEWAMWTPQGYYTGSPGADKIVGWQINKGADQVPDYVGADQLRRYLNRPDIVEKAIILASAEAAVREAPGTIVKLAERLARPVPRFKIISPTADSLQRGERASVKIAIEPTPDPVKAIRVQVNGRPIEEATPDIGSGGFSAGERTLDVPLAQGKNEVRITLTNTIGEKAEVLILNVSFREDAARNRKDNGANLGVLRRRALDVARLDQSKQSLTAKPKRAGWDDEFMLKLLGQMR
jgi:WD40 repeat protein